MARALGISALAFGLVAASASVASAQSAREGDVARRVSRAPVNAVEVQVQAGFAGGFGPPLRGVDMTRVDVGGTGFSAGLGLAYRFSPYASIGVVGSYMQHRMGTQDHDLRDAQVGLDATYHLIPFSDFDPWLSFGGGYRMMWDQAREARDSGFFHGFQLARLQVGVDVRVGESVALAPSIGGDLNMFVWREREGTAGRELIDAPRVNPTLFAGVSGRFDIGGSRVPRPRTLVGQR